LHGQPGAFEFRASLSERNWVSQLYRLNQRCIIRISCFATFYALGSTAGRPILMQQKLRRWHQQPRRRQLGVAHRVLYRAGRWVHLLQIDGPTTSSGRCDQGISL
jgi:hypothetical protein